MLRSLRKLPVCVADLFLIVANANKKSGTYLVGMFGFDRASHFLTPRFGAERNCDALSKEICIKHTFILFTIIYCVVSIIGPTEICVM